MPKRVLPEGTTETIARLTREGWSAENIADHLGVNPRTVQRHRMRAGVGQPHRDPLSERARERIDRLIREGMPSTWVAEDIGCSRWTVNQHRPMGREATREWRQAWVRIRTRPELLALHREFAPQESAGSTARPIRSIRG